MNKFYVLPDSNDKANIIIDDDNVYTLYSYGTPIVKQYPDGSLERLWDSWTATTGRHIKAFCELDKKRFMNLPLNTRTTEF